MTTSAAPALPAPGVRPAPDPRRRQARRRAALVATAVLLVAALVGGWLALRAQVRLSPMGAAYAGFDETAAGTPVVAEDPEPGEPVAVTFWRNDGPVGVTLAVPDVAQDEDAAYGLVRSTDLVAADDLATAAPGTARRTVAPGEQVGVRVVLGFGCNGTNADIAYGAGVVLLDATALGLTRTVALALDPVPMIRSSVAIPADC